MNLTGDEITSGRVRIITEWLIPSTSYEDYIELRNELHERPEISTACLLVYVGHCTDLPGHIFKDRITKRILNTFRTYSMNQNIVICYHRKLSQAISVRCVIAHWKTSGENGH